MTPLPNLVYLGPDGEREIDSQYEVYSHFVPRVGEHVSPEGGVKKVVAHVLYKIVSAPPDFEIDLPLLVPTVVLEDVP